MSAERYQDIIGIDRAEEKKRSHHAPMTMEARAAQFAPFAALTGFDESISESIRLTVAKEPLSESMERRLNEGMQILLKHIKEEPEVTVTYYVPDEYKQGGAYVKHRGRLKRIETDTRQLFFQDQTVISFDDLESLESDLFAEGEVPD